MDQVHRFGSGVGDVVPLVGQNQRYEGIFSPILGFRSNPIPFFPHIDCIYEFAIGYGNRGSGNFLGISSNTFPFQNSEVGSSTPEGVPCWHVRTLIFHRSSVSDIFVIGDCGSFTFQEGSSNILNQNIFHSSTVHKTASSEPSSITYTGFR